MKSLLLVTHLMAFGLGYLLMPKTDEATSSEEPAVEASSRPRTVSLPETANPIVHATSADYKRLWEDLRAEGLRGTFHYILCDWAKLDSPLALRHLTTHAIKESMRFDDHASFVHTLNSLPSEKQSVVLETVGSSLDWMGPEDVATFVEVAEARNCEGLLNLLRSPRAGAE